MRTDKCFQIFRKNAVIESSIMKRLAVVALIDYPYLVMVRQGLGMREPVIRRSKQTMQYNQGGARSRNTIIQVHGAKIQRGGHSLPAGFRTTAFLMRKSGVIFAHDLLRMRIQGLSVADIIKEFGTPLYLYDAEKIIQQLQRLKNAFSENEVKVKYAAKALTNISVLKLLRQSGAGVDVVSINEAKMALGAGFEPQDIMYTPNCVGFEEIEEAVALGVTVNLDNLSMLEKFGQRYGSSYPCCVRLNPHIMAGGHYKISTGHSHSKFGVSVYQLPQIMELAQQHRITINGLHIHTGSEITDTS
jgi:hypothetical protein